MTDPKVYFPEVYSPSKDHESAEAGSRDDSLLKEIRDTYARFKAWWKPRQDESNKDRRYISGNPWEEADRKSREDNGRPCINHDELSQYVNAACNNLRQNKRGIKVEPDGNGSNDQSAELEQGLVRRIEYKSSAQAAYVTAFQQMVEGSYGFIRLSRRYVSDDPDGPDDQEIVIKSLANPDSVLYDIDCKEPDWSDARRVIVLDPRPRDQFKRDYPDAKPADFSGEDATTLHDWINDKTVLVAEYWRVEVKRVRNKRNTRWIEQKKVMQYITNGVEILERNEQPGTYIPVIPFVGLQRYVDGELCISSLVRLARDPQMSLAFLCSQELEDAGLAPRAPHIGYVGQFATARADWEVAHKQPFPFLEVDPIVDAASGQILPLPQRNQFSPNSQAYEIGKESCRRAVQAAMGISPLPTSAQRQNEKSGVALQKIQQQQQIGSFHFNDNFDRALQFAGRIIDQWIPTVYDAEREIAIRKPDDSHKIVRINTAEPYANEKGEVEHHQVQDVDHDITISTGPSNESQREAAGEFLDLLVQNLQTLPVAPPQAAKLLSLAIQMKQLGPKGDEMAEIISPSDNGQSQQQAQALQQAQQQQQAMQEALQKMQAELQQLQLEKAGKVIDNAAKKDLEQMKIEADIAKAEILTKAQKDSERIAVLEDLMHKIVDQGHAASLQASAQQHDHEMADQSAQNAQQTQTADQMHQQSMADQAAQQSQDSQDSQ